MAFTALFSTVIVALYCLAIGVTCLRGFWLYSVVDVWRPVVGAATALGRAQVVGRRIWGHANAACMGMHASRYHMSYHVQSVRV